MAISKDFVVKNGLQVGSSLQVNSTATFSNDVTISGNLTVSGTTTYVNTATLNIADNIVTLNADVTGATAPSENAGLEVNRGSSANVQLRWNETTDSWEQSNAGLSVYYKLLANSDILDSLVSTSITVAASANSVKAAYDTAISQGSTAYSNATTYASNATNISSGTLNTARLPAQVNVSANINAPLVFANVTGTYANITGQVNTATFYATTSANVGGNVQITVSQYGITGNVTTAPTMSLTGSALTIGNSTITGAPSINLANSTGNTTVYANAIGSSWGLISNASGVYHSGVVNAASHTTTTTVSNTLGFFPTTNAIALGNSIGLWVISANSLGANSITVTGGNLNAATVFATGLVNAANFTTTGTVNTATVFATGLVNAANFTTTGTVNTATVYATGRVNAANFTTTGTVNTATVFATGQINAASHTTTNSVSNTSGFFPISNAAVGALGNSTSLWIITANSITANGLTISGGAITSGNVNITGYVNASANLVAPLVFANVSAGYANVTGQVNTTTIYAATSANVGGNVQITVSQYGITGNATTVPTMSLTASSLTIGNSTVTGAPSINLANSTGNTTVNAIAIGSSWGLSSNASGIYHSGVVNAANFITTGTVNTATVYATGQINATSYTVGSNFIANLTAIVGTGYANVTTSVNTALFTVGTAFTANATLVNAAAINVVNQTNTATLFVTTSANVGTSLTINTISFAVTPNANFDSGTLFVDALNNRVGINNTAPGTALRVTGSVDISQIANIQGDANVGGFLGVSGATFLGNNLTVDSGVLFVDAVNNRVGINNTAPGVALRITGAADVSEAMTVGTNMGVSGTLGVSGVVTLSANLVVDATTLFVDAVNNRVGIRDSSPVNALTINGITDTTGSIYIAKTAADNGVTAGIELQSAGTGYFTRSAGTPAIFNRLADDGTIVALQQAGTTEGSITIAGTTTTYGAFCGAHWSQLSDNARPNILRGTVVETIDEMCQWQNESNDQLSKFKISDTAASKSVYGVFQTWDNDDDENNDANIAALGAYLIRIDAGVTVSKGDLLESAGNGCARVQSDDIIRSSTIAKVTNGSYVIETYEDGSYLVPCVLYCG